MTESPTVHNLDPVFSPRSIAVVGASRDKSSLSHQLVHNLVFGEFEGAIFPVNPHAGVVHSLKAYPSIGEVPDPVDLAVIMVPKGLVPGVIDECIEAGVRGLVVITAGFAETGAAGAEVERELCRRVREAGVRMIGPNCMGVINTDAAVSMNATFAPVPARPGSVGFVSQSGALGVAILIAAEDLGIGLTQFVSMGNKADVSGNDLLEYWEDDPETRVIAMYLESFGNPRRFTEIAKRVGRKKPILVVKSGRTEEGARAASSHTGAIAGADLTVSVFLERCGVLRANTIDDLFDMARAFDHCPLPAGNRLAIVTNAGGPAIMATDACVNQGLTMACLETATTDRLWGFLPPEASVANPIDMIASATPESYSAALDATLSDPGVDMVLAINVTPLLTSPVEVLDAITETAARHPDKPVLAVMMATEEFYDEAKERRDAPPVYRFPESAARSMAMLHRYAAWRRTPEAPEVPRFTTDDDAVAELLDGAGEGYLDPAAAFSVLEAYGVPVARWRYVTERGELAAAAERIGFPLVLKAEAPGLVHKSDAGAVEVGIGGPAELEAAVERMTAALGEAGFRPSGFLLQEMVDAPGHEVIYGISTDPRFGPILMFGLGGRYVEVVRDVRFGVPPLTGPEAEELVRGIRGWKILEGVRGETGVDLPRLVDVQLRLAQLAQRHPRIIELDVNPFLATIDGGAARALDVRIRVGDEAATEAPSPGVVPAVDG